MASVRYQQDQSSGAQVSRLRASVPFDTLGVPEMGLGFDQYVALSPRDDGVAAPTITRDRDGHFGAHPHSGSEACPKPCEECEMRSIPHWIAVWIQIRGKLQAHDLGNARDVVDARRTRLGSLNPSHRVRADECAARNFAHAEPGSKASRDDFLGEPLSQHPAAPLGSRRGRWTSRHGEIVPVNAHPPVMATRRFAEVSRDLSDV